MYIVCDKMTKEIIHINPAPLEQNLEGKEVYFQFDSSSMEIGKTDQDYLPENFEIDQNGMIVSIVSNESSYNSEQTDNTEAALTLSQQIEKGIITLLPNEKLVIEGSEEKIVEKTLSELVAEGLVTLRKDQKIIGTGYDEQIVTKTLKEQVQENLIQLSDIPKMLDSGEITLSPEELVDEGLITFDYYKQLKIKEFSEEALEIRNTFLPDYKIENSLLGIYDTQMEADIKTTIKAFRAEFYRLKKLVETAQNVTEVKKIKENYPRELIKSDGE